MALKGTDLAITNHAGESHGYVLCTDKQYGDPVLHSKTAPNVGMSNAATPAQAGGPYDVRDYDGDKAISHIDWTLGAGQKSLDADGATPFMFEESKNINISQPGEMSLLRQCGYTQTDLVTGPVFSAMGYFWLGMDYSTDDAPPVAHNVLMYSADGVSWTHPTITASPAITGLISCFACDGSNVYFGVATGANKGIWRGVYTGTWTFTKYGTSGSTEEVMGLAFNGGQLFAAVVTTGVSSRVAQVDRTTGIIAAQVAGSALSTPVMFNAVTHVALVSAANSVYWVVCQGNKSFIYKIAYDPDSKAMLTQQYMEMPTGFIATCALGYLSTIYVGGYFESQTSGVGKGSIYMCSDGYSAPLLSLGERPEDTPVPSDTSNDNRIFSICEAGKDLYFSTNRGVYRWDIDGAGYSHAYDLNTGGAGVSTITWNPGSEYSYDGTDMTNPADPGPAHDRFPSEWTEVDVGDVTWSHTEGIASMLTGTSVTLTSTPSGDDALDNATGSTMEFLTGSGHSGTLKYTVEDGTKIVRFVVVGGQAYILNKFESVVCTGYTTHASYDTGTWVYRYTWNWIGSGNWYWWGESGLPTALVGGSGRFPSIPTPAGEYIPLSGGAPPRINILHPSTIRCTVLGNTAELSVNGAQDTKLTLSLVPTVYNDASKLLTISMTPGVAIDSWKLNSKDGYPAQNELEVLGYAGTAYCKGKLLSPYIVPSDSTSGLALTGTEYADSGYLTQSETSFHSGTLEKNFRSMEVAHSVLPYGSSLEGTVWIDGEVHYLAPVSGETKTTFPINKNGYSIKPSVKLVRGDNTLTTPVIKAVNVLWDFVKVSTHQYNLHCSAGAKSGRWTEDPETAIAFLYATADEKATFEDRFIGEYDGVITDVKFLEANHSDDEGYSGVLKVLIRQDT